MFVRLLLLTLVLGALSNLAFGQEGMISREQAILESGKYVGSLPAQGAGQYAGLQAAFLESEGIWVVHLYDTSETPPPDSDVMIRVDAVSGRALGFLGGANKLKYYGLFNAESVK